jgi:hypothetical protein
MQDTYLTRVKTNLNQITHREQITFRMPLKPFKKKKTKNPTDLYIDGM